ncbi:hypothetical protein BDA96_03G373700 [Sorghum bicolor]|uniref:Uncharacterized protein n=2 Tax=Sorghum bicolor TaxID=4558 RepID=A0A921RGY4_SORBI|nr:hypothetical protein BDA96_03G373700 [Sorghum bicolor]OQU87809.1 hypothetical protein SORBI_3003G346901 [Sorghum bicolor]
MDEQTFNKEERAFPPPFSLRNNNMPESSGYKNARCLAHHSPPKANEAKKVEMEYGYSCNGSGGNKEKRPPLKRGQLKVQIAKTLLGSLVVPAGAANRERSFGR